MAILWFAVIGLGVWGLASDDNLADERYERIDSVNTVDLRVSDMEARISELERKLKFAEGDIASTAKAHDKLVETFNGNVAISNREKLADMTARGACGSERTDLGNGNFLWRKKQCTLDDLK